MRLSHSRPKESHFACRSARGIAKDCGQASQAQPHAGIIENEHWFFWFGGLLIAGEPGVLYEDPSGFPVNHGAWVPGQIRAETVKKLQEFGDWTHFFPVLGALVGRCP